MIECKENILQVILSFGISPVFGGLIYLAIWFIDPIGVSLVYACRYLELRILKVMAKNRMAHAPAESRAYKYM